MRFVRALSKITIRRKRERERERERERALSHFVRMELETLLRSPAPSFSHHGLVKRNTASTLDLYLRPC
jgi:hypothetical protein